MLTILSSICCNGPEESEGPEPTFARIWVTQDLAKKIIQRKNMFFAAQSADSLLQEMQYLGSGASYFTQDTLRGEDDEIDQLLHLPHQGSFVKLTRLVDMESYTECQVDCNRMVMTDHGVYWSAMLLYTSIEISTMVISYDTFGPML